MREICEYVMKLFANENDRFGNELTKDEIYEKCEGKFEKCEIDKILLYLITPDAPVMRLEKEKYILLDIGRYAIELYFTSKSDRKHKFDNLFDYLESTIERYKKANMALQSIKNNPQEKDKYREKILKYLLEKDEPIQDMTLIGAFGKFGTPEYKVVRYIVDEMVASKIIVRKERKFFLSDNGRKMANGENIEIKTLEKPQSNEELKKLIEKGVKLDEIFIDEVSDLSNIFENYNGDLSAVLSWNTGNVTNISGLFKGKNLSNINLSNLDVSSVTDASSAFEGASNIKGVENWNTKSLENMDNMFKDCVDFNADISSWRTENIRTLKSAFSGCLAFEGYKLNDWHLRNGFIADNAFYGAKGKAEWLNSDSFELYIYKYDEEIPSNFKFYQNDSTELKERLNTGISWLRSEIRDEFKFYFKDDKTGWSELIIELFGLKFIISKSKKDSKNESFCVYLNKLNTEFDDKESEILSEENEVNPLIHIIKHQENYSTGENNDDIYFGYKGIYVDSSRKSLATRTMILYILARAYKETLDRFITECAKENTDLSQINKDACKFNLEKYFTMPVIARDGALQAGVWAKIYDLYELDTTQAQITSKISTMASILEAQNRAELEKMEKERDKRLTQIGLFATIAVTIFVGILPMIVNWLSGK